MYGQKNIAIFLDGTWNKQDCMINKEKNTNVVKMYKFVAEKYHGYQNQIALYDAGVGSDGTYLSKIVGGTTGAGISKNIIEAYGTLSKYFEPGDNIFIFGFSRGAYTARSLAGLIRNCGVIRKDEILRCPARATYAYDFYKDTDPAKKPDSKEAMDFIRNYSHSTDVHFLGVWDTVGALGLPLGFMDDEDEGFHRFHDTKLSTHVKNAFQALAIDEFRESFKPCLWTTDTDNRVQRVEQKWFLGAHSDVGGGYEDDDRLADISLKWMAEKAYECGLNLNVDPTSYLGIEENAHLGKLHDSYEDFYQNPFVRLGKIFSPRTPRYSVCEGNCTFHESVLSRIKDDVSYKPFDRGREETFPYFSSQI